jgi:hypothetical protein
MERLYSRLTTDLAAFAKWLDCRGVDQCPTILVELDERLF